MASLISPIRICRVVPSCIYWQPSTRYSILLNSRRLPPSCSCSVKSSTTIFNAARPSAGIIYKRTVSSNLRCASTSLNEVQRMAGGVEILEGNPLLQEGPFPLFHAVEPKHVCPGIRAVLQQLENDLAELERTVQPTWSGLVEPLEKIMDRLSVVWGVVNHLKSVKDSEDIRSAIEEVQPERVTFQLRLGQSKPIFNAFKSVQEGSIWETLTEAQKRIVEELEDLKTFAKEQHAEEANDMCHWDISFWSERLREAKYNITEEELRPFFSLPKVMESLFTLAKMLFEIDIESADGLTPVWDKDVRFYAVKDLSGSPVAYFYFDPYSRPSEKRGGAWMCEVFGRSRVLAQDGTSVRLPIAHMVCNQTPPVGDKPSLMTFREVETVFHEFGHALQHMLTEQDEGLVAGIRGVEWDAVELPSQFMENWCYHRDTLMGMAKHYETGETLSEEIYLKLVAARTFRAASQNLRQAVKETGKRFRDTVLALGGGRPPLKVFIDFRGREPSTDPLLRHNGLLPTAAAA